MSNADRYDMMLRILARRGYITAGDVPSPDYDAVLDEMCELDWLEKRGDHYVAGDLAIEFGWGEGEE
ncbi:hypothetical protein E2L06_04080 [Haloterrigena sp. H1]|uniref:hypothetical protein n=1 Tax=Haloterrigena sp. H1 TaxID=2552943 RepID=UPI00110F4EDB|nr:hypothetical protein [Haloterrigena sp. H1]TMT85812.1 hypothetical protein E2L06_04080 [Haloterrigena sp. H1]